MEIKKKNPRRSGSHHTGKCSKISNEIRVRRAISECPKTRRQIEIETGVHLNSLDYLIADLKRREQAFVAFKGICPISGASGVQFLTSNPNYKPL